MPRKKTDPDVKFMREALKEAKKAYRKREVPVGAIVVHKGKVIARGHNLVEKRNSAISHAEMEALGKASRRLSDWRLKGCTIYCTVEPCAMCKGAIFMARVECLVFGAPNQSIVSGTRFGGKGIDLKGIVDVRQGVCADECSELMKKFFQGARKRRKVEEN